MRSSTRDPPPPPARCKPVVLAIDSALARRKRWAESESSLVCQKLAQSDSGASVSHVAKCLKVAVSLPDKLAVDVAVRFRELRQTDRVRIPGGSLVEKLSGESMQVPLHTLSSSNKRSSSASGNVSVITQETDRIGVVCLANEKLLIDAERALVEGDMRPVETLKSVLNNLLWLDTVMKGVKPFCRKMPRIPVRIDTRVNSILSSLESHWH